MNIFQGLPHFMPILSADLLRATKLPQPDSQKKDFSDVTSVLVAVCVCLFVCVPILFPNTCLNLVEKYFFSRLKHFFCVTQLSQMEMGWLSVRAIHHSSNATAPLPFLGSAWLIPAISPPHAVAFRCTGVAITGNGRDHSSKPSNSFSSPGIRADQRESSSSALNTWA